MKKKFLIGAAIALTALFGGQQATAQETKSQTETVTKKTGPGPNTKVKTIEVTGKVTEYEAGKEIEIEGPEGTNHEFDLDENARIEGTVTVGQMATVHYVKGDDGKEHVLVLAAGAKKGTKPAEASQQAAPGARMHVESTTKHTGSGPNTKEKREVVIGIVKEYEPGKGITIVGPKDEDFTFDLDEQVSVKGPVAVGQTARVEYTKGNDGVERVVILTHVAAKKKSS